MNTLKIAAIIALSWISLDLAIVLCLLLLGKYYDSRLYKSSRRYKAERQGDDGWNF